MFERAKMSRRQSVPEDRAASDHSEPRPRDAGEPLTRAQARALSRCAPLTPAEFKQRRQAAEQGLLSLASVLGKETESRKR